MDTIDCELQLICCQLKVCESGLLGLLRRFVRLPQVFHSCFCSFGNVPLSSKESVSGQCLLTVWQLHHQRTLASDPRQQISAEISMLLAVS